MGLSGPSPSFAKMGVFLAKQAFKGIKDNVHHYQRGKGLGTVLSTAAKIGYKLGKDKGYKRMGAVRVQVITSISVNRGKHDSSTCQCDNCWSVRQREK